jgi:uncharacterized protein (TIGR03643 family)
MATKRPPAAPKLSPPTDAALVGELIEMALSDHVSFDDIRSVHGLGPDQVKALMRANLAPGSYKAWRRRVRRFADQRAVYK